MRIFINSDASYGTEKVYGALRLAINIQKESLNQNLIYF